MKVYCYDINYVGKEAIISITGPEALKSFAENGCVNYYGSETAPKEITIEVFLPIDWLNDIISAEQKVKCILESEVGLKVARFNWRPI